MTSDRYLEEIQAPGVRVSYLEESGYNEKTLRGSYN